MRLSWFCLLLFLVAKLTPLCPPLSCGPSAKTVISKWTVGHTLKFLCQSSAKGLWGKREGGDRVRWCIHRLLELEGTSSPRNVM